MSIRHLFLSLLIASSASAQPWRPVQYDLDDYLPSPKWFFASNVLIGTNMTRVIDSYGRVTLSGTGGGGEVTTSQLLVVSNSVPSTNALIRSDFAAADARLSNVIATLSYTNNVQWWGAVGDGTTDDTAAFSNALAKAKTVWVPYTANGYRVTTLTMSNKTALVGLGVRPKLLATVGVTNFMLSVDSTNSSIQIVNVELVGTNVTSFQGNENPVGTASGIKIAANTNAPRILNCVLSGFNGYGIYITGSTDVEGRYGDPIVVSEVSVRSCHTGIKTDGPNYIAEYAHLANIRCESCRYGFLALAGNVAWSGLHAEQCGFGYFDGGTGNSGHSVIAASTFNHCTTAILVSNQSTGLRFTGCSIYNSTTLDIQLSAGIAFDNCMLALGQYYLSNNLDVAFANCWMPKTMNQTVYTDGIGLRWFNCTWQNSADNSMRQWETNSLPGRLEISGGTNNAMGINTNVTAIALEVGGTANARLVQQGGTNLDTHILDLAGTLLGGGGVSNAVAAVWTNDVPVAGTATTNINFWGFDATNRSGLVDITARTWQPVSPWLTNLSTNAVFTNIVGTGVTTNGAAILQSATNYASSTANNVSNWVNSVSNRVDSQDAAVLQSSTNYSANTANNVSNFVSAVSNRFDTFTSNLTNADTVIFQESTNFAWTSDNALSNWVRNVTNSEGVALFGGITVLGSVNATNEILGQGMVITNKVRLLTSATVGQIWTATNANGLGSWSNAPTAGDTAMTNSTGTAVFGATHSTNTFTTNLWCGNLTADQMSFVTSHFQQGAANTLGMFNTSTALVSLANGSIGQLLTPTATSLAWSNPASLNLGAGGGNLQTNDNQFAANTTLTIKDGVKLTNVAFYGASTLPTLTISNLIATNIMDSTGATGAIGQVLTYRANGTTAHSNLTAFGISATAGLTNIVNASTNGSGWVGLLGPTNNGDVRIKTLSAAGSVTVTDQGTNVAIGYSGAGISLSDVTNASPIAFVGPLGVTGDVDLAGNLAVYDDIVSYSVMRTAASWHTNGILVSPIPSLNSWSYLNLTNGTLKLFMPSESSDEPPTQMVLDVWPDGSGVNFIIDADLIYTNQTFATPQFGGRPVGISSTTSKITGGGPGTIGDVLTPMTGGDWTYSNLMSSFGLTSMFQSSTNFAWNQDNALSNWVRNITNSEGYVMFGGQTNTSHIDAPTIRQGGTNLYAGIISGTNNAYNFAWSQDNALSNWVRNITNSEGTALFGSATFQGSVGITNQLAANSVVLSNKIRMLTSATVGQIWTATNADGSGSWSNAPAGNGTPGGNSGAIQFTEGTSFAGTNEFLYDRTNKILTVSNLAVSGTMNLGTVNAAVVNATNTSFGNSNWLGGHAWVQTNLYVSNSILMGGFNVARTNNPTLWMPALTHPTFNWTDFVMGTNGVDLVIRQAATTNLIFKSSGSVYVPETMYYQSVQAAGGGSWQLLARYSDNMIGTMTNGLTGQYMAAVTGGGAQWSNLTSMGFATIDNANNVSNWVNSVSNRLDSQDAAILQSATNYADAKATTAMQTGTNYTRSYAQPVQLATSSIGAATMAIDMTSDQTICVTNGFATSTFWLTNIVDRKWFVLRCGVTNGASTITITNSGQCTMNVINTNGFSVTTLPQMPVAANKIATIIGRAWVIAGTTNVDLFGNVQQ